MTMPIVAEGVDYSAARPGGSALKNAGKQFAVRYLYPYGSTPGNKGLTQAEVNDLQAHGIAIPVVFEGTAGGALKGHGQGVADAQQAQAELAKLTLPHDLPIYFAVDFDINGLTQGESDAKRAAVTAYFRGVGTVLAANRVGGYGGYDTILHLKANSLASWYWQTYAWSGGRLVTGIHLYQWHNGTNLNGSVDLDSAMQAEYGQHSPAVPVVPPVFKPDPKPGRTFYTLGTGKPNLVFWRRLVWVASPSTYKTFDTMGIPQWKKVQQWLARTWGYLGNVDGDPQILTNSCLQKVASSAGYKGPIDGDPQTQTYKALAKYVNTK